MEVFKNTPPPAPAPPATYNIVGLTQQQAEDLVDILGGINGQTRVRRETIDPLFGAFTEVGVLGRFVSVPYREAIYKTTPDPAR